MIQTNRTFWFDLIQKNKTIWSDLIQTDRTFLSDLIQKNKNNWSDLIQTNTTFRSDLIQKNKTIWSDLIQTKPETLRDTSGIRLGYLRDTSGYLRDTSGIPEVSTLRDTSEIPLGYLRDTSGYLRDTSGIPEVSQRYPMRYPSFTRGKHQKVYFFNKILKKSCQSLSDAPPPPRGRGVEGVEGVVERLEASTSNIFIKQIYFMVFHPGESGIPHGILLGYPGYLGGTSE